jgi:hypothetical protein
MPGVRTLEPWGLCTFYSDESDDKYIYVIASVAVPTLVRRRELTTLEISWDQYLDAAKQWRRALRRDHFIPIAKELKGSKLATGHNSYGVGGGRIAGQAAFDAYQAALRSLTFLAAGSVFSVYATRGVSLYGHDKLEAALYALFQRMQKHCEGWHSNALVFFDEGHNEYRTLFRKSFRHLPTGSRHGNWGGGRSTRNLPFASAIKDANFKNSAHSPFVQIADLVAYATLLKARSELGRLSPREIQHGWGDIHNAIPRDRLNLLVSPRRDGIVSLTP